MLFLPLVSYLEAAKNSKAQGKLKSSPRQPTVGCHEAPLPAGCFLWTDGPSLSRELHLLPNHMEVVVICQQPTAMIPNFHGFLGMICGGRIWRIALT